MHHYPFHVGDYCAHTQHLDELEDLAYRRMLDYCYLNECGLPETIQEIARVLKEFFVIHEDGTYRNKRADIEIDAYKSKAGKASQSAKKRWENRDANALPTDSERNANQNQNQNHISFSSPEGNGLKKADKIDYQAIINLYHTILPELPKVINLTDKRKAAIRTCANTKATYSSLEFWQAYFDAVKKSDWLMGRAKEWKADIDFLTRHSSFIKIIEGSYR